ncbi:MAG TPA: asparagine synthase (glutamine-hydrolyzing) [Bryobacteraceae bacterium]|nr:asparagine synthase (glutamine-hydrolyzing) [Bryobacteraceae bacterium]
MCGINGLYHFDPLRPVDEALLDRMRAAAVHRGPDDKGLWTSGNVGLAFNRLSIIDLSGGHQPMSNEDGTVFLIFNGEIYNFMELRDRLIARGYRFRTRSDTETIVHAWEEYGERCVDHLRGMFAFALWDSRRQVLFGARDRLGIKPFYYYLDRESFAFASEMKSLLQLPQLTRELDETALAEYLLHRYVIGPRTMLRSVKKLQAGHTIALHRDQVKIEQYWDVPLEEPRNLSEPEALEELEDLLQNCVKSHLISDVPLGAFLSGGLDSSSVVALMHKMGVSDIKTFSIGYNTKESELGYAKIVADHFATDHYPLELTASRFRDSLPQIVWNMDEPVGDEASIPLYYLSQFARKKVTVALSGEGSDEIFAGYPSYARMLTFEKLNHLPLASVAGSLLMRFARDGKARKYAAMLGRPLEMRYGGVSSTFTREQAARLLPSLHSSEPVAEAVSAAYQRSHKLTPLARMSYLDLKTWLADDLLVKADRMSMAHSLELRVPFLDHKLVEFGMRLPDHLKLRGKTPKYLLKKLVEPLLPRQIVHREKQGFPVPTRSWFRDDLAGFARETLLATEGAVKQIFSRQEIERLLSAHEHQDRSQQIYALLVFDQWYRQFVTSPLSQATSFEPVA